MFIYFIIYFRLWRTKSQKREPEAYVLLLVRAWRRHSTAATSCFSFTLLLLSTSLKALFRSSGDLKFDERSGQRCGSSCCDCFCRSVGNVKYVLKIFLISWGVFFWSQYIAWQTGSETPAEREVRLALGFKPRNVSSEMVSGRNGTEMIGDSADVKLCMIAWYRNEHVSQHSEVHISRRTCCINVTWDWWLPSWNRDNIRFDLLRTGNVETTTNKIIERGFLEAVSIPPPSHLLNEQTEEWILGLATRSLLSYLPSCCRRTGWCRRRSSRCWKRCARQHPCRWPLYFETEFLD